MDIDQNTPVFLEPEPDPSEAPALPREGPRQPLAVLLVEAGIATHEQLRAAQTEGIANGERLGEVLLRKGWIDELALASLLADQWGLPFLAGPAADPAARALIPSHAARDLAACPISLADHGVTVALAEPNDDRLAALRARLPLEPTFAVVTKSTLERLLANEEPASTDPEATLIPRQLGDNGATEPERPPTALDHAADQLATLTSQLTQLLPALLAATRDQLAQQEHDREDIRALETRLTHREQLLNNLRAKLAELAESLDNSHADSSHWGGGQTRSVQR